MTDKIQRALSSIPPRTIAAILEELGGIRQRMAGGEDLTAPLTTLHLKSGKELTGWPLVVGDESRSQERHALLFQLRGSPAQSNSPDVVYVDIAQLEAVTVHDATATVHLLSNKWADPPPGAQALTRLEIRRKSAAFAERIRERTSISLAYKVVWDNMPPGEDALHWLAQAMSEVTSTLIDVLANDYARQTLGAALQGVRFTPGPKPSVALDGGALVVQIAPARGRESFLTGGTLRAAIEDLF